MNKVTKFEPLRMLDFSLAAGSLLYGIWASSALWIIGGFLGFVLAWINPGKRIKEYLFVRLKRAPAPTIAPSSAFPLPPTIPYVRRHPRESTQR